MTLCSFPLFYTGSSNSQSSIGNPPIMEFPILGEHCSYPSCKRLDFLPLYCDHCRLIFCKEHAYPSELHQCKIGRLDSKVPICPICSNYIIEEGPIRNGPQNVHHLDFIMNEHIDSQCRKHVLLHNESKKNNSPRVHHCSLKTCKSSSFINIECPKCGKHHCPKHRWSADHHCPKGPQSAVIDKIYSSTLHAGPSSGINEPPKTLRSGRSISDQVHFHFHPLNFPKIPNKFNSPFRD